MSYNLEQFKDGLKELQIELNEKQISQFLKLSLIHILSTAVGRKVLAARRLKGRKKLSA